MTDFSPREIVSELDRYIIGQNDAKRAVAIALRNRWRRLQLDEKLREEVLPKNILMIGPTGVGKTEISRRLAKLAGAPFLKVEATKFTEVGYVGRDVEQIIRDLLEIAIAQTRERRRKDVSARAQLHAEERVLDALVGASASASTKDAFRKRLRAGELNDKEIEIEVAGLARHADVRDSRHAGRPDGRHLDRRYFRQARRRTHQDAPRHGRGILRGPHRGGIRQAARQRPGGAGIHQGGREQRHRVPRRDRQDLRPRGPHRRRRLARGRAARSAAADRGHHRLDQARRGEDRPYPVHRVGRVPSVEALRPVARAAGPPADPGRAAGAHARRSPPHPDRARSFADQAICGAA